VTAGVRVLTDNSVTKVFPILYSPALQKAVVCVIEAIFVDDCSRIVIMCTFICTLLSASYVMETVLTTCCKKHKAT
jgi:hypothetical protein